MRTLRMHVSDLKVQYTGKDVNNVVCITQQQPDTSINDENETNRQERVLQGC